MRLEDEIRETLKAVVDPEIGLNIVDLGLVYDIKADKNTIAVTMTLTTPGCPMHDSITSWAKTILEQKFSPSSATINLVWEPQWTPEMMSDEAREQLNI